MKAETSVRVRGHALRNEGRGGYTEDGRHLDWWSPLARGKCSCGLLSEPLPSDAARKRWHRIHKAEVLAAEGTPVADREAPPASTLGLPKTRHA